MNGASFSSEDKCFVKDSISPPHLFVFRRLPPVLRPRSSLSLTEERKRGGGKEGGRGRVAGFIPMEGAGSGSGDILIYSSKKHQIYRLCTAPVSITSRAPHNSQLLVPRHDPAGAAAAVCGAATSKLQLLRLCLVYYLHSADRPDRVF